MYKIEARLRATSSGEPKNQREKRRNTHCLTIRQLTERSLGISASRTPVFRVKCPPAGGLTFLLTYLCQVSRNELFLTIERNKCFIN